jgi:hypothetical protein
MRSLVSQWIRQQTAGYEVGKNEFLLVEDRDLERARSVRFAAWGRELAEPPQRASQPTVALSCTSRIRRKIAKIMKWQMRSLIRKIRELSRSTAFFRRAKSTAGILGSRTMSCPGQDSNVTLPLRLQFESFGAREATEVSDVRPVSMASGGKEESLR